MGDAAAPWELRPTAAEGMGNHEHNELSEGYSLDEQEGAIGAKDTQRAFGFAWPIERQQTRRGPDQPQVLVRGGG